MQEKEHNKWYVLGVFVFALLVYLRFGPHEQPVGGDLSMWDYMAQSIARGSVPYRDVVNIKTPLGAYIGAAAIWLLRPLDVRDLFAIRYAFLLQAALVVALTYLLFEVYWQRRLLGVLAASIMLSYDSFGIWNASGAQVKTTALLFGLLSIYLLAKQKYFWAGFVGSLSFWAWQPGLLFAGVAGLCSLNSLKRGFVRVILGTALGVLLGVGYFFFVGAARAFYDWCFSFNISANTSVAAASGWARLATVIDKAYPDEWLFWWMFPVGFLVHLVDVVVKLRNKEADIKLLAPTLAFVVYGLFTYFNLQSGPDAIFFLPFIALYCAYLAMRLGSCIERFKLPAVSIYLNCVLVLGVVTFFVLDAFGYNPAFTLDEQQQDYSLVFDEISPMDKVYAHGSLDLLVLGGLVNASKYIYFDRGKDVYAAKLEGGFDKIIGQLEAARPRFVALSKLERVQHKDQLLAWLKSHYDPYVLVRSTNSGVRASVYTYEVYVRRGMNLRNQGENSDRDSR
ncbi:MAG: DolP-mannose mannosyltransferase [Acidobacteriota bacterium]|nr:DolP-mannose mannosyltransferase [Blastocatellia bacterium]MDW8413099.1 DolP-mannose mannosyltransferase [Acidobacteriota bacterium]